jgi:hypothetical protein
MNNTSFIRQPWIKLPKEKMRSLTEAMYHIVCTELLKKEKQGLVAAIAAELRYSLKVSNAHPNRLRSCSNPQTKPP